MPTHAFEELAQDYIKPLYSYCLSLMCDPHRAEELAQETLVRAYENYPSLKNPDKFYPWLKGIAQRCRWTWFRSAKHNPVDLRVHSDQDGVSPTLQDDGPSPADQMEKRERTQELLRALKKLSRPNREVVILRYFEELSYAEIAMRLGVSIDAVDQRLTRAKLKLRNLLQYAEI
ncbi:MAG: RNA polymerase sigma factor [Candidatus Omnitrophica bacterium]|nr:RNA polymerase sigma factor [Candidatus Omnitrophota bacterium]